MENLNKTQTAIVNDFNHSDIHQENTTLKDIIVGVNQEMRNQNREFKLLGLRQRINRILVFWCINVTLEEFNMTVKEIIKLNQK